MFDSIVLELSVRTLEELFRRATQGRTNSLTTRQFADPPRHNSRTHLATTTMAFTAECAHANTQSCRRVSPARCGVLQVWLQDRRRQRIHPPRTRSRSHLTLHGVRADGQQADAGRAAVNPPPPTPPAATRPRERLRVWAGSASGSPAPSDPRAGVDPRSLGLAHRVTSPS